MVSMDEKERAHSTPVGGPEPPESQASEATSGLLADAFETLLSCSSDFVLLLDQSSMVLAASASFARVVTMGADPRGRDFLELLDPGSRSNAKSCLDELTDRPCLLESDQLTPNHTIRLVNYRFCRFQVLGETRIVAVGRDQESPPRLVEHVVRLNKELEESRRELDRSHKELEQFAYVASHALQEPLRMVSSYTQLLARRYQGRLDSNADEFIAYAVGGTNRMQRLINDLLAYSRVGTRGKEFKPTDCTSIFDQALANLKVTIEESGAVVARGPLPTVLADKSQIGLLLQNLIGNAIKYHGDQPPRVHVTAEQKGK
jgi:signal transduction histidine kinase